MARAQHELLKINIAVAESSLRLVLGGHELRFEVGGIMHFAHALAAAAGRRLDENGVSHGLGERTRLFDGFDDAVGTGNGGDAAMLHGVARGGFVAHRIDAVGRRADEDDAVVGARTGEVGILGEEAVSGMDRLCARVDRGRDDGRHDQVALVGGSRTDADLLVGIAHRIRVGVLSGVHRNGLDAHFLAGAHDAQGNLAAICY